jgi:diguanylate cyclase (GGDEF)-like protein
VAADGELQAELRRLWADARPAALKRVDLIDDAVAELMVGALADELRRDAEREAHKLAGSLGTFGVADGSRHARALEEALAAGPGAERAGELAEHAVALRHAIDSGAAGLAAADTAEEADVVAVGLPRDRIAQLTAAAAPRGLAVAATDDPATVSAPVLLLDGTLPDLEHEIERLAGRDEAGPSIAVVLAADSPHDRVELVRRGACRLLPADAPADALVEALAGLVRRRTTVGRILAVDDDPTTLMVVRVMLERAGYEVAGVEDPLAFWAELERVRPDLVVCDVDMPELDGIALCRTLRADARWQSVPVLFLTAHTEAATVSELFAAGADDFVPKPVVGPELIARVGNRLERMALLRAVGDVDQVTGLLRREAAHGELENLLRLARRLRQPLWVAAVVIDGLGAVNRDLGHAIGDAALAEAGRALRAAFGADGVAARWGGGDLVVAMLGLSGHDARDRLGAVLEEIRTARLGPDDGVRVTASAGLAELATDGDAVDDLVTAALGAARVAHDAGGDRVATPADGGERETVVVDGDGAGAGRVDVALVEDDDVLAPLLLHALQTRGYRTEWLHDGDDAARRLGGERPELRADLIVLDWDLPSRDGLTVLRGLAADGSLVRTKVVMLTFRASEREILQTLELGADDHVAKPFSVPVLMQRVRRLLAA